MVRGSFPDARGLWVKHTRAGWEPLQRELGARWGCGALHGAALPASASCFPSPGLINPQPAGPVPQLGMEEWVVVQDQRLQVHEAPHLRGQGLQSVVAQVQVQQVRQVDEQLVWDVVDAGGPGGDAPGSLGLP